MSGASSLDFFVERPSSWACTILSVVTINDGSYPARSQALCSVSRGMKLGQAAIFAFGGCSALARLIEFQYISGGLCVETFELFLQGVEICDGNSMIFGVKEQQRHRGLPREGKGLGQDQRDFPAIFNQSPFDHFDRQRTQQ